MAKRDVHSLAEGQIYFWVEQSTSIHLKAVTATGDPVELNWREARELGQLLLRVVDQAESNENSASK